MSEFNRFKLGPATAYALAVQRGFEGTLDEWLASLKGKAFTYDDFTQEQLQALKGDKGDTFTFEDLTQEQVNALKGAKGDPFTYEDFTADQLESLRGPSGKDGNDGSDGKNGQNGVTPHIGSNGNWYIGTTDTGVPATGPAGKDGSDGKDGSVGPAGKDGAGVPAVTTADDGKFLRVASGVWTAVTVPNAEGVSF